MGSTYEEFIYGPTGAKLAKASGQILVKAFVTLPGAATAIYNSSGVLSDYRHSDWLGSSRITSTASRTLYSSTAYAPFGEQYQPSGTADASFTGQNADTTSSLYDFMFREHSSSQGRWISPDPAGAAAVDPTNPQSWNRYAYVNNTPTNAIDPLGLYAASCADETNPQMDPWCGQSGDSGGGGGGPEFSINASFSGDLCDSDFMLCRLPNPGVWQSLWEALGLPTGLNCPESGGVFGPLCGGG
jgi:RHS repeat-associated protein